VASLVRPYRFLIILLKDAELVFFSRELVTPGPSFASRKDDEGGKVETRD
jgi:hypothetical protein